MNSSISNVKEVPNDIFKFGAERVKQSFEKNTTINQTFMVQPLRIIVNVHFKVCQALFCVYIFITSYFLLNCS